MDMGRLWRVLRIRSLPDGLRFTGSYVVPLSGFFCAAVLAMLLILSLGPYRYRVGLPDVPERARERGFLGGELASRSTMRPCDFFREVPSGCRAYVVKHVIHDWDDERGQIILANCRRAVPADGVVLFVGWVLPEGNAPSVGKFADVVMLLMTGGKERTVEEYRRLLARASFRLNPVVPTSPDLSIIEALAD